MLALRWIGKWPSEFMDGKMISRHWRRSWHTVVLCVCVLGCNQSVVDSGPSYAELVVTYNAELEALDRLEAKREKVIKEYAASSASNMSVDTLEKFEGLLKSATALNDDTNPDTTSDPSKLLDDLTERREGAREIAGQLLDGLLSGESDATSSDPTPEEAAAIAERKAVFEEEFANLDSEISRQKERVARARQARDLAESKLQSSDGG